MHLLNVTLGIMFNLLRNIKVCILFFKTYQISML